MSNNKSVSPPPRRVVPPSRNKKELTAREKLSFLFPERKEDELVTYTSSNLKGEATLVPPPTMEKEDTVKVTSGVENVDEEKVSFEHDAEDGKKDPSPIENENVTMDSSPEGKRSLGIDRRKVLIGAICAVGVLLCILLATTIFGKKSSAKSVVDAYMKCYMDNNIKEGITKYYYIDETLDEVTVSQEVNAVEKNLGDYMMRLAEYEIVKEESQGEDNAVVDVLCKQSDDMEYVFKFIMVRNKKGEWKIKKNNVLFMSAKSAADFAMRSLVVQNYDAYAYFIYVDENKPENEQISEIDMVASSTRKMYSENPVTEYEILNVENQGDDMAVVEVKIKQKNGKESTSKMNMVKNNDGEWKIKASNDGNNTSTSHDSSSGFISNGTFEGYHNFSGHNGANVNGEITVNGSEVTGRERYSSSYLDLNGYYDTESGRLEMYEYYGGNVTGTYEGFISGMRFQGTFTNSKGRTYNATLNFR